MSETNGEIRFFVEGTPKPQPRPRAFAKKMGDKFVARVYDSTTAEGWKSCIAVAARPHLPAKPLSGPLRVDIEFIMPRPKAHFGKGRNACTLKADAPYWCVSCGAGDRDNLDKAVLDTLTAIRFWWDDSQVCAGGIRKRYAKPGERSGAQIDVRAAFDNAVTPMPATAEGERRA